MTEHRYSHEGSCRCGSLRIHFHCDSALEALRARSCQCEFCLPRGASYVSDTTGRLEVRVRDRRLLYAHVFGTGTADFMHCARCNHLVFVRSRIDGRNYALVVVQALNAGAELAGTGPVDYHCESLPQRLSRRAASWIPDLEVVEDDA